MNEQLQSCPFCHDTGFDEVGLKIHLTAGHCDPFTALSISLPKTTFVSPIKEGGMREAAEGAAERNQ